MLTKLKRSMNLRNLCYIGMVCLFYSCELDREEEPIPSYIYLDQVQVEVLDGQGSARHQFKDVWVYANDQYLGAYELPIKLPVTAKIPTQFRFFPGYRKNGQLSTPARFPFMDPFEYEWKQLPSGIDTIPLVFRYASDIQFPFVEDFNRFHFFNRDLDGNVETVIRLSDNSNAFEGSHSGEIVLDQNNTELIAAYDLPKPIPVTPNQVLLELHYKSEIPFYVGFIAKKGLDELRLINALVLPRSDWNKIYFDFTEITNDAKADEYRVAIAARYVSDSSATVQHVFIDNVKVSHR